MLDLLSGMQEDNGTKSNIGQHWQRLAGRGDGTPRKECGAGVVP